MRDKSDALFDIDSKNVVITGAAGGIGRVLCRGLTERGARVIGTDIAEPVEVAELAAFHRLDLADGAAIQALAAEVERDHGPVEVLINAGARGGGGRAAEDTNLDVFAGVLQVNVTGAFACAQAFGRCMAERRRGKIINFASACGIIGYPFSIAYNASKASIWSITQTLAVEWARFNIQVNAIVPGFVNTPMNRVAMDDVEEMTVHHSLIPAGRISEPEDLVGPIVFLSAAASDYVTGALLVVDGGTLSAGGTVPLREMYVHKRTD